MSAQISTKKTQSIKITNRLLSRTSMVLEDLRVVIEALRKLLHDFKDLMIEVAVIGFLIWKIIEYLYSLPHR
jgi:DNA-binding winged helix-turn-helix (wHTH) protein